MTSILVTGGAGYIGNHTWQPSWDFGQLSRRCTTFCKSRRPGLSIGGQRRISVGGNLRSERKRSAPVFDDWRVQD